MLTADQMRGRVRVTIDGNERVLRFDQTALVRIVESLQLEGLANIPDTVRTLEPNVLRVFVWAGLIHEDEDLTIASMRDWFFPFMPTLAACVEGINLAIWGLPDGAPEVDNDDADPTMENGSGGTSTTLDDLPSEGSA